MSVMLQITKSQSGSELQVVAGETFEVRLPENPTTGYRWQGHDPLCGPALEFLGDSFDRSGETPGAGGTHTWRFRAVETGATELSWEYQRAWEKKSVDTFRVTIQVKTR
jgi:inhibitor of cysteine peptidase